MSNETIFEGKNFIIFDNTYGDQFKIAYTEVENPEDECYCTLYRWSDFNGWLNVVDDNGVKSEVIERLKSLSEHFPDRLIAELASLKPV
jgi:hypothetical protein